MSAGAIKAGKAYVELSARDKVSKVVDAVKVKLDSFARGASVIGGALAGIGSSVLGGLAAAAMKFSDVGSQLFDMSQQTGVSAETLSALSYSADQTGVSLSTLGSGLKGMAKFALQVSQGSKGAQKTLDALGVSAADFLAASPEQRMGMLADGLSQITDDSLRAGLAAKVFGRAGMDMIPMLKDGSAGLEAMSARARELGLVMSNEDAAAADALGDALGDVRGQLGAVVNQIGAAVAPAFTTILTMISKVLSLVIEFAKQNRQLVVWLAIVAAVLVAVGGSLLGVAVAAAILGGILTGLMSLWGALAAVVGFLFSPLALIIGLVLALGVAIAAGAIYFALYTEMGRSMVATLSQAFLVLWRFAKQVFQGIFDAIMTGNWKLAGDIAMAALNVAFQAGMFALQSTWLGFKSWFINLFADMFDQALAKAAAFHSAMMATINGVRGAQGLAPIDDVAGTGKAIAAGRAAVQGVKTGVEASANKEMTAAMEKLTAAQNELTKLTDQAAKDRNKEAAAKASPFAGTGGIADTAAVAKTSALGAFNASVAAMLGRSGAPEQDQVAANTAKANELLEDIKGGIDELGLEAV